MIGYLKLNSLIYVDTADSGKVVGRIVALVKVHRISGRWFAGFEGTAVLPQELQCGPIPVDSVAFSDANSEPIPITPAMLRYLGIPLHESSGEIQLSNVHTGSYDAEEHSVTVSFLPRKLQYVHELQYMLGLILDIG